jgi:hemin uptake protein HemP
MNQTQNLGISAQQQGSLGKARTLRDVKTISSQALFCDSQMVEIHHGSEIYQLRLTKAGKMILTK